MAPNSKKCVFLGYGKPSEMGFCLWVLESKKILCSTNVYFNEDKMHKKPVEIVEIRRIVFQEDGQVHNRQLDNALGAHMREERNHRNNRLFGLLY